MKPDLSFYQLTAQIIPVLFIALAFEAKRFFADPLSDEEALELYRRRTGFKPNSDEEVTRLWTWFQDHLESLPEDEREKVLADFTEVTSKSAERQDQGVRSIKRKSAVIAVGISLIAMLLLVVGEAVAVSVSAGGHPSDFKMGVIGLAIAAGGYLIVLPLVQRQVQHLARLWPSLIEIQNQVSMTITGFLVIMPTAILWP